MKEIYRLILSHEGVATHEMIVQSLNGAREALPWEDSRLNRTMRFYSEKNLKIKYKVKKLTDEMLLEVEDVWKFYEHLENKDYNSAWEALYWAACKINFCLRLTTGAIAVSSGEGKFTVSPAPKQGWSHWDEEGHGRFNDKLFWRYMAEASYCMNRMKGQNVSKN